MSPLESTIDRTSRRAGAQRWLAVLVLLSVSGSFGCWEQMSSDWFPQMKRQLAVQAFEYDPYVPGGEGLTPPDGTVAVGNPYIDLTQLSTTEQDAIANPVPYSLTSLKRGEEVYNQTCSTCHGVSGGGDGPVAGVPFGTGPFGMVLPIGGPMSVAKGLSDGHIFATITLGRGRMPSYRRIAPDDRWDVINYIRDLNGQGGRQ